jgi:hypothetical protein
VCVLRSWLLVGLQDAKACLWVCLRVFAGLTTSPVSYPLCLFAS